MYGVEVVRGEGGACGVSGKGLQEGAHTGALVPLDDGFGAGQDVHVIGIPDVESRGVRGKRVVVERGVVRVPLPDVLHGVARGHFAHDAMRQAVPVAWDLHG